jgi:protein-S-isoprenylcysteine O-methyltransferase Ste14
VDSRVVQWVGEIVTLCGLSFAVLARIHLGRYWSGRITLKKGHKLIRSGPYRHVRHPIYAGFLAGLLGSCLTAGTLIGSIGFMTVLGAYFVKIVREEKTLTDAFGDEYLRFKNEVPALIPFWR